MKGFWDMKKWIWITAILISVVIIINLLVGSASVHQPLKYSHKKHVDAGLECIDCHLYAKEGVRATIPALSDCMECHEEAITESKEEEVLRTLFADGILFPWEQLARVPEDVLFSHRRHTAIAEIECSKCHGMMQELEEPPTKVAIKLSMDFCMDCHKKEAADNDCIACHR
jgi:hypothetical protein